MRTRAEISRRLSTLTQALYFRSSDRDELSEEGRIQLRALEDNIALLEWCLQEAGQNEFTGKDVREAFRAALRLLWLRVFHHSPTPSAQSADHSPDRTQEVP